MSAPTPTLTLRDPIEAFASAIAAAGLPVPEQIVADGQIHRFSTNGRSGDGAGWYVLHISGDDAWGAYGDHRSGVDGKWSSRSSRSLAPAEQAARREQIEQAKREDREERARRAAQAAATAARVWENSPPAPVDHPYLRGHGLTAAHGSRVTGDGKLVVCYVDLVSDATRTVQFIPAGPRPGKKKYLNGSCMDGAGVIIGDLDLDDAAMIVIAEGWATAAAVHQVTGLPAVAAGCAGQLVGAAEIIHERYPAARITIAGDSGEVGERAALEAAREVCGLGLVAIPQGVSDWADVLTTRGPGAVKEGIESAQPPAPAPASPPQAASAAEPPVKIQIWDWSSFVPPAPQIDWLIDGLLPLGGAVDVYGPPGSRKSTIIYHLAATIAAGGGQWFRWPVTGGRVAIIGGESSNKNMHWRMARRIMTLAGCEPDPDRIITIPDRPILRWARGYQSDGRQEGWDITPTGQRVLDYLHKYQPTLVVIDTILAGAHGCNIIDQAQQYALAEELGRIARAL
ncbi:MAG: hypothetical protein B7Z66_15865, partial [Chromatiales bacterium 21-64-14]